MTRDLATGSQHEPTPARSAPSPRPLLIGNDFPPDIGGIEQYVAALAERLPDAAVVAGALPPGQTTPTPPGPAVAGATRSYPVFRGRRRFLWPTPATVALLRRCVADHGADVAVFTAPFPLPPAGPFLGIPFAVLCHGAELVWPAAMPGAAAIYRRWLRRASCLFAVSRYTAGHLRTLVGPDGPPIRLAHPGVDLGRFRPRPSAGSAGAVPPADAVPAGPSAGPLIVSVGRLVPRKGTDVLIRALPVIRDRVPGAHALIVGDGRWRGHLERLVRRLVGSGRLDDGVVTFTGRAAPHAVAGIYATADLAVMPVRSRWGGLEQEGFGMVFVEAQACGVPVVAGRSGGAGETVLTRGGAGGRPGEAPAARAEESGLVVDGADVAAVADAVVALLADSERRRAMADAARRHVERRFDWDVLAASWRQDLAAIARGDPPPRHI